MINNPFHLMYIYSGNIFCKVKKMSLFHNASMCIHYIILFYFWKYTYAYIHICIYSFYFLFLFEICCFYWYCCSFAAMRMIWSHGWIGKYFIDAHELVSHEPIHAVTLFCSLLLKKKKRFEAHYNSYNI